MRGALLLLGVQCLAFAAAQATRDDDDDVASPNATPPAAAGGSELGGFWEALSISFGAILATEIGDRTFFIAAIMAMRHSRLIVWLGAVGALVVMTVLSTLVGHVAPMLISRYYTQWAAAGMFLFFGQKMLREGLSISHAGASEELEEVEAELSKKVEDPSEDVEEGVGTPMPAREEATNKILMQAFTLTFIAEWGDRSQIATIALAAAREPFGVTLGGCIGHSLCTGLAVIGGKLLAASISERTVLIFGGVLFIIFAFIAAFGFGE